MAMKLFDAELKLMEVLWKEGVATASQLAKIMNDQHDWKTTTTYTFIKRCISKGAIERVEPSFVCRPLVTIDEVRAHETTELINKMYNGIGDLFVTSLVGGKVLSKDEIERLKKLIIESE